MVRKDFMRIVRIWSQTLLPPVVTTTLYFAIFGAFIGSQLAPIHGFSYMQFIVPGLVMMSIITSSYMNTVSTFYFAKWQRTIDEHPRVADADWVVIARLRNGRRHARPSSWASSSSIVSLFFTHLVIFNISSIFAAAFLTALLFSLRVS
jgi:ABC-2 type transport system permease protein